MSRIRDLVLGPRPGTAATRSVTAVMVGVLAAGVLAVLQTTAVAATGPSDGTTFTVGSVKSGKLLDVYGAATVDDAPVIQYAATGKANQRWTTRAAGSGAYSIVSENSGKCLSVRGASISAGAAVTQMTCVNGAAEQTWTVTTTAAGVSTVRSVRSGLCLDVTGGSVSNGAAVVQWTCSGNTNQQWLLDPADATGSARVGTWGTSLNPGGRGFTNQTVRQVLHVSVGGTAPQLRVSNLFGSGPLTIGAVDIASQASGGTAVTGSHRTVTFGGSTSVTVAAGQERTSDPVSVTVTPNQNLLVSIFVSNAVTSSSWHSGAMATTWVSSTGNHVREDGIGNYPTTMTSWYLTSALSVVSTTAVGTVVAFGDSITEGYGSGNNANRRYPDYLARRLVAAGGGPRLSVVNAGIGGNRVLTDRGNTNGFSALNRFSRDALGQPGVRDVILLEGINDLRGTNVQGQSIIAAYQTLIDQAHAAGVSIYGGTILPCGGSTGWTTAQDEQRNIVNTWIRTSGAFDGVIDFDAAIRNPADRTRMLPAYDVGDHLHPNGAGYEAMANAVNLSILN